MRWFSVELEWLCRGRWHTLTTEVGVRYGSPLADRTDFSDPDKNIAADKAIAELKQAKGECVVVSLISVKETQREGDAENLEIKVTSINGRWHARLFENGVLADEMACYLQEDIGWICREMLNWRGRMGSTDARVESARRRHEGLPVGGVIYCNKLDEEKMRRMIRQVEI